MRKGLFITAITLATYFGSLDTIAQSNHSLKVDSTQSNSIKNDSINTKFLDSTRINPYDSIPLSSQNLINIIKEVGEKGPISELEDLGVRYKFDLDKSFKIDGVKYDNSIISYVDYTHDSIPDRIAVSLYDIHLRVFSSSEIFMRTYYDDLNLVDGPEKGVCAVYGPSKARKIASTTKNGDLSIFGKDLVELHEEKQKKGYHDVTRSFLKTHEDYLLKLSDKNSENYTLNKK